MTAESFGESKPGEKRGRESDLRQGQWLEHVWIQALRTTSVVVSLPKKELVNHESVRREEWLFSGG